MADAEDLAAIAKIYAATSFGQRRAWPRHQPPSLTRRFPTERLRVSIADEPLENRLVAIEDLI